MFAGPKLNAPADPLSNAKGNSMAEDLVKRLRQQDIRQHGGYVVFNGIMAEAASKIEHQAASLAVKDKEISTLKMALDDETNGISAACRDAETLAAKDAEIKRLGKCYDLAMKSRLEWRHRADQAERVFTDICEELGCKPDNEAALEAVAALKRALTEAVEVMRRCENALSRCYNVTDWPADGTTDQDKAAEAARAFVAQHGSDSRKGK